MILKLPRVIRLDQSDTIVFEHPAEPGDWAVTGSFLFWDEDIRNLAGKGRAAFRSGFLGVPSFGFSTLVVVGEASEQERDELVEVSRAAFTKGRVPQTFPQHIELRPRKSPSLPRCASSMSRR